MTLHQVVQRIDKRPEECGVSRVYLPGRAISMSTAVGDGQLRSIGQASFLMLKISTGIGTSRQRVWYSSLSSK